MSYLAQYGVRRGVLRGTTFVTNSDPPNPFSYSDVGNFIIAQLDADNLPEPDSDWPIAYCVIMPANVAFQGDSRFETVPLPAGTAGRRGHGTIHRFGRQGGRRQSLPRGLVVVRSLAGRAARAIGLALGCNGSTRLHNGACKSAGQ
jgi:hypothetical protein